MSKPAEVSQNYTITIDELPRVLDLLAGHGDPAQEKHAIMLLSAPGIGKTEGVTRFAQDIGAELRTVVASTLDRMDVSGLPFVDGKVTRFAPMSLLADLDRKTHPDSGPVVLYFNELMDAPESVYPVLMRLFNERAIGEVALRDNIILIADGNPPEVNVSGRSLPFALRRRFAWVVIRPDVNKWVDWAMTHDLDARVPSFFTVGDFKQHFSHYDPVRMRHAITYPSPASWTKLAGKLPKLVKLPGVELRSALLAAYVGTEAATAFNAYLAHMDKIPNVAAILQNPEEATLPDEPSMLGLLVGSAVNLLRENPKLLDNTARLANRLLSTKGSKGSYPEYGAFLIRAVAASPRFAKSISATPAFKNTLRIIQQIPELISALQAANYA